MENILSNKNVNRFMELADSVTTYGSDSLTPGERAWLDDYLSALFKQVIEPLVAAIGAAVSQVAEAITAMSEHLVPAQKTAGQINRTVPAVNFIEPNGIPQLPSIPSQINTTPIDPAIGKMDSKLMEQMQAQIERRNRFSS